MAHGRKQFAPVGEWYAKGIGPPLWLAEANEKALSGDTKLKWFEHVGLAMKLNGRVHDVIARSCGAIGLQGFVWA